MVDPRTTWPLDEKTLIDSAKKTSRVIVLDEGYGRYGVTAELAAVIAEGAFYDLDAPVKRMGAMHVPIPFSPPLEDATVPTEQTVFEAARELCGKANEPPRTRSYTKQDFDFLRVRSMIIGLIEVFYGIKNSWNHGGRLGAAD